MASFWIKTEWLDFCHGSFLKPYSLHFLWALVNETLRCWHSFLFPIHYGQERWNVHKMAIMTCSKWISTIFQAFCHTFCGAHANFGQTGNNRALITLKKRTVASISTFKLAPWLLHTIPNHSFQSIYSKQKFVFCVNVRQTILTKSCS